MIVNGCRVPEPPKGAFWVFAYGSLMWRPGFDYTSRRAARLFGYRRALCVLSHVYRGSPEQPGLVFGLDVGGSCVGRVYHIQKSRRLDSYQYLMEREMIQGVYTPCWRPVSTPAGRVDALCFVVDRRHEQYAPGLAESEVIARIKSAHGINGSNAEYIVNTCRHLEALGVRSPVLARLHAALAHAPAQPGLDGRRS